MSGSVLPTPMPAVTATGTAGTPPRLPTIAGELVDPAEVAPRSRR